MNRMFLGFILLLASASAFGRSSPKDDVACLACTDGVNVIDYLLGSPLVEGSLQKLLASLCTKLPDQYQKPCTTIVNGFMDKIIGFIVKESKHICDSTCKNTTSTANAARTDICGNVCMVLTKLYNEMPIIAKKAEAVCDEIPNAELAQSCHEIFQRESEKVVDMGRQIVVFIQHQINRMPLAQCQKCSIAMAGNGQVKDSITCEACKDAVAVLEYVIDSPLVKGSLEDLLKGLCKEIPDPYGANCVSSIDQFFDLIVKFIKDMCNHICDSICTKVAGNDAASMVCSVLKQLEQDVPSLVKKASAICPMFPDEQLSKGCQAFFAEHEDMAADFISKFIQRIGQLPMFAC